MMSHQIRLMRANMFQIAAHGAVGQVRKYTGEPYHTHPQAVAHILQVNVPDATTEMIEAAYLHDVLEDTKVSLDTLEYYFGEVTALYVDGLTERLYPGLNRAKRKALEVERLSRTSPAVQTVKVADLIHNTADITKNDPDFAKVYMREKRNLLVGALTQADSRILSVANAFVDEWFAKNA
jgi:(p)ppGpp synthase/HD superfamily hydrolase